jgi:hypothetical protein
MNREEHARPAGGGAEEQPSARLMRQLGELVQRLRGGIHVEGDTVRVGRAMLVGDSDYEIRLPGGYPPQESLRELDTVLHDARALVSVCRDAIDATMAAVHRFGDPSERCVSRCRELEVLASEIESALQAHPPKHPRTFRELNRLVSTRFRVGDPLIPITVTTVYLV